MSYFYNKKLRRSILILYILSFISSTFRGIFYGVGSNFYTSALGLEKSDVFFIKIFNPIIIILFEMPTGFFGDRKSRKFNYIVSNILCGISFFIYYMAATLEHCIAAEIIYSLSLAFFTGSINSLVISEMRNDGESKESIAKVISNKLTIVSLGSVLGGTSGILIYRKYSGLYWLIGSIGVLLNGIIAFFILEENKDTNDTPKLKGQISEDKKGRPLNHNLLVMISLAFGVYIINSTFYNYWSIYLPDELGIPLRSNEYIVVYLTFMSLLAIGNRLSLKASKLIGKYNNLSLSTYLMFMTIIMMLSTSYAPLAICAFFASEFFRGLRSSAFVSIFNENSENENRSFNTSALSTAQKFSSALGLFIVPMLSRKLEISTARSIAFLAIFSMFITFIGMRLLQKKES